MWNPPDNQGPNAIVATIFAPNGTVVKDTQSTALPTTAGLFASTAFETQSRFRIAFRTFAISPFDHFFQLSLQIGNFLSNLLHFRLARFFPAAPIYPFRSHARIINSFAAFHYRRNK